MSKPHYDFKQQYNKHKINKKHNKSFKILSDSSDSEIENDKQNTNAPLATDKNDGVTVNGNHIYYQTKVCDSSVTKLITIINNKNNEFKKLLENKMIESAQPKNLWLHITSYGGSLFACFRAIDAIKNSVIPIYTIVDGYAASAGTLMSVVGKRRYMNANSYMLIHQLSTGAIGTFWEIKDEFDNSKMMMDDIYNIYLENSKLTREELESYLSHDLWWKSDKCMETGLIDEIYVGNQ